jgi:hypothetical protein
LICGAEHCKSTKKAPNLSPAGFYIFAALPVRQGCIFDPILEEKDVI